MFGFGGKKEVKKVQEDNSVHGMPELPKLPELPKINYHETDYGKENSKLPQLPSYPKNNFGEKFSRDAIKDAVSGEKEDENEGDFDDDFNVEKPLPNPRKTFSREFTKKPQLMGPNAPQIPPQRIKPRTMNAEPVFVRMDHFEESLAIFEKTKEKITEMEKMLRDIKKTRDEEERELSGWEAEIQSIKNQFQKIDSEIFSKI